jgi:voltage-gated potassium channel
MLGTLGFWLIGERNIFTLDYLFAAAITVIKTALNEIPSFTQHPYGKVLAIFLSFTGLVILSFIISSFTAFFVEGQLSETFRRRKMEKMISKLKNHYIVCGLEGAGFYIIKELHETKRPYVIVDIDRKNIEKILEKPQEYTFIEGDPTDSATLLKAGIMEAKGVFAVIGDDNQTLVISLTAKHLNPHVRVVAKCIDTKNIEKLSKAGADAVVSPTYIGGLRMASEMIRPTVVSFLDIMLRDKEKNLRVEEVSIPDSFVGKPISILNLKRYPQSLLLAVKTKDDWVYNPSEDYIIQPQNTLIFITNPQERSAIEESFSTHP